MTNPSKSFTELEFSPFSGVSLPKFNGGLAPWRALLLGGAALLSLQIPAFAQAIDTQDEAEKADDTIVVVGSRRIGGSLANTPAPVDLIDFKDVATSGAQIDLAQSLQYLAPSFNSTRQTGADGADHIDSAALRGLSSDQTLVLLDNKRQHTVALVNLFGARNRGNTGTDLNVIPTLAIERVEVLRDGAAAQYGSDAIAGVLNIRLKKTKGFESVLTFGEYTRGDGKNYQGAFYYGTGIGKNGFGAITGEYLARGRSDRLPDGLRIIGDSRVNNGTVFLNGAIPLGAGGTEVYAHAGYQHRFGSSGAFERGGIGSGDIPGRNSAAQYPDGFVPFIDTEINDVSSTIGVRGKVVGWNWDFSSTYGFNELFYTINNTLNASIANLDLLRGGPGISPSSFDAGGFSFQQSTTNVDFTRFFDNALAGVNIAFGGEYRRDFYRIVAGEPGSFNDVDGPGGGSAGSQGFPGFQPNDETRDSRGNWAVYADIEANLTKNWLVDVAGRFERYSDFGATAIGKFATAYTIGPVVLRGSVSSGFRAPSLQQRRFSSTFTNFISGVPVNVVLAPNGGTIARAAGIPDLRQETSRSYTVGWTATLPSKFSITADGYWIAIKDRILLTGQFGQDDPNIGATLIDLDVGQAQFFANAADTRTRGFDVTLDHRTDLWGGKLRSSAGFNVNFTQIRRLNLPAGFAGREDVFLSERERLFIENGAPRAKGIFGVNYAKGPVTFDWKFIYFGPQTLGTFTGTAGGEPNARYNARLSADVSLSFDITKNLRLTGAATNIFDRFPTRQNDLETDNGFIYESVQFGLNGASYVVRLSAKF